MVRQIVKKETKVISITKKGIIIVKNKIKDSHSYINSKISHTRI